MTNQRDWRTQEFVEHVSQSLLYEYKNNQSISQDAFIKKTYSVGLELGSELGLTATGRAVFAATLASGSSVGKQALDRQEVREGIAALAILVPCNSRFATET